MPDLTVNEINSSVKNHQKEFILKCEDAYRQQVCLAAKKACENKRRTLVMVAGPSSSGKTTTSFLLKKEIEKTGRKAMVISLDDFYKAQEEVYHFEDGTIDYETVKALDVGYFSECIRSLMDCGKCLLPKFSFLTKQREGYTETLADENDIIIVEGLHALNPAITDSLADEPMVKLYVSVSSRILKDGEIFMSKRDIRFVRRLIRDFHFRNSEPEHTFYLWNGVRMGEDRYLFPFSERADIKINSIHPYEACVFKDSALDLLDRIGKDSIYYKSAANIKNKLAGFVSLSESAVPENSLLTEFIG